MLVEGGQVGTTADFLRTLDSSVNSKQSLVMVLNCQGLNSLILTVQSRAGGTLGVLTEKLMNISDWRRRSGNHLNAALRKPSGLPVQLLILGNCSPQAAVNVYETIPKIAGVEDFAEIPPIPDLARVIPFGALWLELNISIMEARHPHIDIIKEDSYFGVPIAIENADFANSRYAIPEVHEIYVNPELGFRGSLIDLESYVQLASRENSVLFY
jgi:hypothetical protein